MTNQSIGETTLAIKTLLQNKLNNDYVVSLYEPWSNFGNTKGINLFLYRVEENAQWKNMHWQGTMDNPAYNNHTPLSLDLFYLITPYAPRVNQPDTDDAECHRLLGMGMQILHENPVLNDISTPEFDSDNNEHFPQNLKRGFETIKVSLQPINSDDMSKIWSMGNNPYKLSVAYHVSLVQIAPIKDSTLAAEVEEIGVGITGVEKKAAILPSIEKIDPEQVKPGENIKIIGDSLTGSRIKINIGSWEKLIKENLNEKELEFTIPVEFEPGNYQFAITISGHKSNAFLIQIVADE